MRSTTAKVNHEMVVRFQRWLTAQNYLSSTVKKYCNFEKLCGHVPLSWAEQREHFGFPPVSSQRSKSLLQ